VPAALDVAVVGCGTAGPAAALFLKRAGHAVTVFERFAAPRPLGAGFLLQPTGMAVLDRLGLLEATLATGARIDRLHGKSLGGRTVMDLHYSDLGADTFGLGLHRGALFQLLAGALAEAEIPLVCDTEIAAVETDGAGRPALRDARGGRHGPFDLVVAADGTQSALRPGSGLVRRDKPYGWGAVWTICADADGTFSRDGTLAQVYDGARRMAGVLPVGRLPDEPDGAPLVSFFWSLHASRFDAWRAAGLAAWKDEVRACWPETEPLLATIGDIEALSRAAYRDAVLDPWHGGRVVYIGDAGHCMSPQLGQGANVALVDALVLGQEIARGPGDVEAALARYSRRRRAHIRYYQQMSRWLTPAFQSGSRPLGWARDLVLGPFCRAPLLRGLMLSTMAGLRAGLFRRFDLDA